MTAPQRLQRRRTKGWRMPPGAVYVGRPTKWGNPFDWRDYLPTYQLEDGEIVRIPDADLRGSAVSSFEALVKYAIGTTGGEYPHWDEIRAELAGRDLVCWCPLDQPCHADVLLEIANAPEAAEVPA